MSRYLVVVADDDDDFLDWLVLALAPLDAEIHQVCGGAALWRRLVEGVLPDLVITDVRMPAPDGLEVLAQARGRGFATPFLLITSLPHATLVARAAVLDAEVLARPLIQTQLLTRVRKLLARGAKPNPPGHGGEAA